MLLEVILGFLIILAVVLIVASLFPSSYQASIQAGRMSAANHLARQVLERQKQLLPDEANVLANQHVDASFETQGRAVTCQLTYRVERASSTNARPVLWRVIVEWDHAGKRKNLVLIGAGRTE